VFIVIGTSLLAFIVGLRSFGNFGGGPDTTIGLVDGSKINVNEYSNRLSEKEALIMLLNPEANMDDMQRQQLNEEVWNDILRDKVFHPQYNLLGITVSKEEINDMLVGETVHPSIRQQFINQQTGMFDPNMVIQYSSQFEDESAVPEDKIDQWRAAREYWSFLQQSIKEDRFQTKYNNLITKGLYVTTKEARSNYMAMSSRANIRFVFKPYSLVPDSSITLTDDEIKKYYNEFKYKFRQKKSRSLKYVLFMGIPTPGDSTALHDEIVKIKNEWAADGDDTLYVYENSENPSDPTYYRQGALSKMMDSLLFNSPNGTLAGPFIENGYYVIGKKISERMVPDSVKARHILLQPTKQEEVETLRNLRDSLFTVLQNGGNFAEIAAMYSADQSNAKDTGNLGWFTEGQMVPQFNDTAFSSSKGQLKKVDTQFGYHIIYIQDQTKPKKQIQVALVNKLIKPSDETMKVAYSQASEFAFVDRTQKDFDSEKYFTEYTRSKNLMVRDEPFITESSRNLMGMDGTKEVIKWSLTAKRGEISDIFQSGNNYIVAMLSAVRVDGIPKLEDIRSEVEVRAKQHKKAEQFIQEFTTAMGSAKTIDALAAAMKLQVVPGNDVTFGSFFIPGAGIEPELLGTVFGSKPGQLTAPIEGNSGVFVAVLDAVNQAPEMPDYTMNRVQLMQGMLGRAANEVGSALKEKLKVQDLRYKFDFF